MPNLVSVIIPNYNHDRYLKQRIDSVLGQTYKNLEVIILDDCSTDESHEVINQYKGEPAISHIIFNTTNSGSTFKQWKKGIDLAQGEYIWIAESDDWCDPGLLEELVNGIINNDKCVLAYAQSYVITNVNHIDKKSSHDLLFEYVDGKNFIPQYMAERNSIFNASMAIFKKECYFNISDTYTNFKFCGDWLFWVEIAKQGQIYISGKVLNYFRKHGGDITGKVLATGYNFIEEIKVLKILKNDSLIRNSEYKSNLLFKYIGYLLNKNRFTEEIQSSIEKEFYFNGDDSFKWFLISRSNPVTLLKLKATRRLKALFN